MIPKKERLRVIWFCLLFPLVACAHTVAEGAGEDAAERDDTVEITVILDWIPNTNHTGVFVAKQKGWYADAGLDVEIIRPSESQTPLMVASGQADFGFSHQESVTFARTSANPVPVVAVATVNRHNTSGFASPADRGITKVKDFEGKTYGGWGSVFEEALLEAVMKKEQADFSSLTIVNVGTTDFISSFRQGIDFRWIFYGWDGVRAEVAGWDFNYIPLIDIDPKLDYYTPVLITRASMMEEQPETIRAFLSATETGYRWAAENAEEAAEIMLAVNPDLDGEFLKASQEYLSEQYLDEEGRWGGREAKLGRNFGNFLNNYDLLDRPFDAAAAFTNEFLPRDRP